MTEKICANCNEAEIRELLTIHAKAEIVCQLSHIVMSRAFTGSL